MPRLRIFVILTLLIVAAVLSVTRLRFSANIYDLLPRDLPEVQGMDRLNRHFSLDRELLLTLAAASAPEAEAVAASLHQALQSRPDLVAGVVRELPIEAMAQESSELVAWLWLNGEPSALATLQDRLREGSSASAIATSLTAIEEGFLNEETVIQSYDPLGLLRLRGALDSLAGPASNPMSSEDGSFRVLFLTHAGPQPPDYRSTAKWLEAIRGVIVSWQAEHAEFAQVEIGLTGTPAFMATIGTRMEQDLSGSLVVTTVLIAILFALIHRRLQPLLWLVSLMLLILCATLQLGSFLVGNLSVMSAGFAAILMGLAVDYGVVLYREAGPSGSASRLRRRVGPGILWAAATTSAVFLSLNLSSLPGLAQLGNLVAIGVVIGAVVMLFAFAPLAARFPSPAKRPRRRDLRPTGGRITLLITLAVPVAAVASLALQGPPALDPEFRPFRIDGSPPFQAWRQMERRLSKQENTTLLIVTGDSNRELLEHARKARQRLDTAESTGLIQEFSLPTGIIPDPDRQATNAKAIRKLLPQQDRLLSEIEAAGFSEEGSKLTRDVFARWTELLALREAAGTSSVQPTGALAKFALGRLHSTDEMSGEHALLATVRPVERRDRQWIEAICDDSTSVASLGALGTALNERIRADLVRVFLPLIAVLSVMLFFVFRSWRDFLLSVGSLLFAGAVILILTLWTPLGWNAFNVCAIPILFGTGLDYGIHMVFALRRNGGNLVEARETIGKALLFCGGSTAIGFGTLGFAAARGLATLGQICAAGILVNMIVAVWILPRWWSWLHRKRFPSCGVTPAP